MKTVAASALTFLLLMATGAGHLHLLAQEPPIPPGLEIHLLMDYASAEGALELYADEPVNTAALSSLRGSRIAASTAGLIADSRQVEARLAMSLDSLRYRQILRDDVYRLEPARQHADAIRDLLQELKRSSFARRVAATVGQVFPNDARLSLTIPVYVVAFGHGNVDAVVRRIVWEGDTPRFAGTDEEGELTIAMNIARAAEYGDDTEERLVTLLGVVAHEVFHVAFSAYTRGSPAWRSFAADRRGPFEDLLELTQNEGIAYYLSVDQRGRGYFPGSWRERAAEQFAAFNRNAGELLSPRISRRRAAELLRTANLSGFWDSYGAMTGMVMAREIDLRLGRQALIGSIEGGPYDFFRKYIQLTLREAGLPPFSPEIVSRIPENP